MTHLSRRAFLSRSLQLTAASVMPLSLVGCGNSTSEASGLLRPVGADAGDARALVLSAVINGTAVTREQVMQWEAQRLQIVAQRMQGNMVGAYSGELQAATVRPATSTANLAVERQQLADAKIKAGDAAMRALVANDLALTTPISENAALFPGWAISEIDIFSNRGTAERFATWFSNKTLGDDQRAMLVACPDHYLLHPVLPNGQMVIETTGGATQAAYFVIDYNNPDTLPVVQDPAFPVMFNGAAKSERGATVGGTNHRLRTLEQGFQIHPTIFFPAALPPTMISEHRWHLACEFSNWIEAYIAEKGD